MIISFFDAIAIYLTNYDLGYVESNVPKLYLNIVLDVQRASSYPKIWLANYYYKNYGTV